jgi:hypothetical protein
VEEDVIVSEERAIEVRAENPLNIQTSAAAEKRKREAQRKSRQANYWQEAHPSLRRVYFVLDASLWQQFVKLHCATEKPNVVFTRMIREAVQAREGSFESGEP